MKPSQPTTELPTLLDDRLSVSICEACRLLSIGRTLAYQLIKKGQLKTIKVGERRLILMSSIIELATSGTGQ